MSDRILNAGPSPYLKGKRAGRFTKNKYSCYFCKTVYKKAEHASLCWNWHRGIH